MAEHRRSRAREMDATLDWTGGTCPTAGFSDPGVRVVRCRAQPLARRTRLLGRSSRSFRSDDFGASGRAGNWSPDVSSHTSVGAD